MYLILELLLIFHPFVMEISCSIDSTIAMCSEKISQSLDKISTRVCITDRIEIVESTRETRSSNPLLESKSQYLLIMR